MVLMDIGGGGDVWLDKTRERERENGGMGRVTSYTKNTQYLLLFLHSEKEQKKNPSPFSQGIKLSKERQHKKQMQKPDVGLEPTTLRYIRR